MKNIPVIEYGLLPELSPELRQRLLRFDRQHARDTGEWIFDWREGSVKAQNIVGVVHIPGLTVEILPKIDRNKLIRKQRQAQQEELELAQANLLTMLSYTRQLPIEHRDHAPLHLERMPLLEAFILAFATRLLEELRKGVDQAYVQCEENLGCVKGRLLIGQHLRENLVHKERFYVGYDDFISDTPLNRILKAACRKLLFQAHGVAAQEKLRQALLLFDEISDVEISIDQFERLRLNRNNERFGVLVNFCRIVLLGQSPAPREGNQETFSLLFPMEKLFEEFIAEFLCRHCREINLDMGGGRNLERRHIHVQSKGNTKYLLRRTHSQGSGNVRVFRLKPDLLIRFEKAVRLIVDTKWKHLKTDEEDRKNGIQQSDLYQMYAYAKRFECPDVVLLYPRIDGVRDKTYWLEGNDGKSTPQRIHLRTVALDLNLRTRKGKSDLCQSLREAFSGFG